MYKQTKKPHHSWGVDVRWSILALSFPVAFRVFVGEPVVWLRNRIFGRVWRHSHWLGLCLGGINLCAHWGYLRFAGSNFLRILRPSLEDPPLPRVRIPD